MCGIAGWFGLHAACDATSLIAALRHRGPDGEGFWCDAEGRAGLVHTRLAILDLSETGAQPMGWDPAGRGALGTGAAHDGARYWIAFNGEIYNFRELRAELESAGETFSGQSDTEVLLRLLVRKGKAALPKLAGMFAFAFYDRQSGRALLARDAFGIKPLYYAERDAGLAFGSEVRALSRVLPETATAVAALRDALLWGSVPEPATLHDGIFELPAGGFLEFDGAATHVGRWHELRFGGVPGSARSDCGDSHGTRRVDSASPGERCASRDIPQRRRRLDCGAGPRP